jgi:hypothetical protein
VCIGFRTIALIIKLHGVATNVIYVQCHCWVEILIFSNQLLGVGLTQKNAYFNCLLKQLLTLKYCNVVLKNNVPYVMNRDGILRGFLGQNNNFFRLFSDHK